MSLLEHTEQGAGEAVGDRHQTEIGKQLVAWKLTSPQGFEAILSKHSLAQ